MFDLRDVSFDDAVAHRDWVQAREPARLVELARWIWDTNGPVEALDASVESLVALWEWFLGFSANDLPGVPREAHSARWLPGRIPLREPVKDPLVFPAAYVGEAIEHYVMLVCQRIDPGARWGVHLHKDRRKRAIDPAHQHTVIRFSDESITVPLNVASTARRGLKKLLVPEAYRDAILIRLPEHLRPGRQARQAPVLPAPDTVVEEPPRWVPTSLPPPDPMLVYRYPKTDELPAPGKYHLFKGPMRGLEEPQLLVPLKVDGVTDSLFTFGFRSTDNRKGDANDLGLTKHGQRLLLERDGITVLAMSVVTEDGALRAISFDVIEGAGSPAERQLTTDLRGLANYYWARLRNSTDDNEYDDDSGPVRPAPGSPAEAEAPVSAKAPSGQEAQAPENAADLPSGEFEMINGPREGLADHSLLGPLDAQALIEGLNALGFGFDDGDAPTVGDLLEDGVQLVHVSPGVCLSAETCVVDGTLRALFFEPVDTTDAAAAQRLTAQIKDLAEGTGARLTASYLEG